jgi:hypothetical protein
VQAPRWRWREREEWVLADTAIGPEVLAAEATEADEATVPAPARAAIERALARSLGGCFTLNTSDDIRGWLSSRVGIWTGGTAGLLPPVQV